MQVTIKDVAKAAGVSPATVSRVISNHPRISAKTAAKVRSVMNELGYYQNIAARSLVSKSTRTIGVILPRPAEELFLNYFFSETIRGIVTQTSRAGYDLLMASGASEHEEVNNITRLVRGRRVDGIILLSSRRHDPLITFLKDQNFPFILVGRSPDHPDILSIDNDNVQASYDAACHLISQGHERIGFVSGPPHLVVSQDRLDGYKQALADHNLSANPRWIVEGEFLQESGYRAMSSIMNLPQRPTAMVVIDDIVALGVLRGLNELGYSVPDDISIISFNNIALSELTNPPLSTIDIGIYQMAYTASHTLIQSIEKHPPDQSRTIIPHQVVPRRSTSPIP